MGWFDKALMYICLLIAKRFFSVVDVDVDDDGNVKSMTFSNERSNSENNPRA